MHIAEGVLSAPVLITGAVVATGAVAYGLKKLDPRQVMMAAILQRVAGHAHDTPLPNMK